MQKTLRHLQRQLNPESQPPVLPQAPAGHFWRVTNRLLRTLGPYGDPYYYLSDEAFDVELHKELAPTRFRKRPQSSIVYTTRVVPAQRENEGFTVNELTVRAAEQVLAEVGAKINLYNAIKQVVGDYR